MEQPHPLPRRATWTDLTVEHHGVGLLRSFSASAADGQLIGVVGPASESLNVALLALAGRYGPVRGSVEIVGAPASVAVVADPVTDAIDDPLMRVREAVLEVARVPDASGGGAFAEWSLSAAGLADRASRVIGDLTVMERVRLGLALAAASGATVIVLDISPVAADPGAPGLIVLLRQLASSGRLLLVGAPAGHESFDLVLPVPAPMEVVS
jgi:ABC-type taurine transport system ATPase subunit